MYLVDTNIIIYYLEGQSDVVSFFREHRGKLAISPITWMETLSYDFTQEQEQIVRSFLAGFKMINISASIMEIAVSVRKQKKIKLPDAIIAATAIEQGSVLVTRNQRDFKGAVSLIVNL
ncbi:MAG: type II toxin-antitoxin system VapC family toxin [Trichlorobacter sp.]|uniref:type II toxin-antitoxin system VapC family toxin n=1 Tax=Trichlorobacter sp. TaxID=2911007 RepID=UPI00255E67D9|nr:type II toxin-antitoxin system VapC family toxin [Trichlorobacter sp.]MDK9718789.1 type II toxin-antitoxin system VapC family toxin [Trichlorobacter sp.]